MTTSTKKIDLRRLPAAARLTAAVATMREAATEQGAFEAEKQRYARIEAQANETHANLQRLRDRRTGLLAEQLTGADVTDALAAVDREIAQAEADAARASDLAAAAARVKQQIDAKINEQCGARLREGARAVPALRYEVLREAAAEAVQRFMVARDAFELAYGEMVGALLAGNDEVDRNIPGKNTTTYVGQPPAGMRQLCSLEGLADGARQAHQIPLPNHSSLFNYPAERERAREGVLLMSAMNTARAELNAQIDALSDPASGAELDALMANPPASTGTHSAQEAA